MRCRLVGGWSDSGICLLFDGVTAPTDAPEVAPFTGWVEEETVRGGVFRYDLYGSGHCALDCFIDEEPPPEIMHHCLRSTDELLLRLPGGRLCFASAEALIGREEEDWDCAEIPPGDYSIRAWLLQPVNYRPLRKRFGKERIIGILALLVFLMFGLFGLNPVTTFAAVVIMALVLLSVIVSVIWHKVSGHGERRRRELEHRLRAGPPDLVIRMTPVADTDGLSGGGVAVAGGVGQDHPWPWAKCSST